MRSFIFLISFFVGFTCNGQQDSLRVELMELNLTRDLQDFLDNNPDTRLQLFDAFHDSLFFTEVKASSDPYNTMFDWRGEKARLINDTVLTFISFDYIYLPNSAFSVEKQQKILKKVNRSRGNKRKFDRYIVKYGNSDPLFHSMFMVDAILLEDKVKEQVIHNSMGDISGVETDHGMFICYTIQPAKEVNAYLGIVVP